MPRIIETTVYEFEELSPQAQGNTRMTRTREENAAIFPLPIHGGKDPDGMNAKRVVWGLELAFRVQELTSTEREDAIADAINYLLHYAHAVGDDPAGELARAIHHFNAETSDD